MSCKFRCANTAFFFSKVTTSFHFTTLTKTQIHCMPIAFHTNSILSLSLSLIPHQEACSGMRTHYAYWRHHGIHRTGGADDQCTGRRIVGVRMDAYFCCTSDASDLARHSERLLVRDLQGRH